jgi:hypothetical protein
MPPGTGRQAAGFGGHCAEGDSPSGAPGGSQFGGDAMKNQALRYLAAIVVGALAGELAGVILVTLYNVGELNLLLTILSGGEKAGGQWRLNVANVVITLCKGGVTGWTAGYVAKTRGKLMAVLANFAPLIVVTAIEVISNREMQSSYSQVILLPGGGELHIRAAFWVWLSLIPAILGGHYAVRTRITQSTSSR